MKDLKKLPKHLALRDKDPKNKTISGKYNAVLKKLPITIKNYLKGLELKTQ